ncbi:hypothetical protein [Bradyrhizobium japonicum]|uniref:hypothetical protein n=1 Tax=Bradyrhizobium japonicum TaxID=375 RepID=UPI001B89DA14|nr:hypothetical protein [Bradyrhizobium japonicum]
MAQTPPYTYPLTIGTSSTSILIANPTRKRVIFHNPNDTAKVAVCPVGPSRSNGAAVTAAINGPGCITILPYDRVDVPGPSTGGAQLAMPSAWIGIASAGGSALTIFEFE